MKMIRLFLAGAVFSILSLTVAAAGEQLLIVKVVDSQATVDRQAAAEAADSRPEREIVFDKLAWSVGSPPLARHNNRKKGNDPYELQVLNDQGEVLYTKSFDFIRDIEVPLPEPGKEKQGGPSRVALEEPEAVLVIPYFSDGAEIRVKGIDKKTVARPIPALPDAYTSQEAVPSVPAQECNFYVLLMASGFSDMSGFRNKAQGVKNLLLSREPFISRKENVVISAYENTDDLGCYTNCLGIDRLMCCDSTKVMAAAAASGQLYHEIIVIHDIPKYSGGGYRDYGSYQDDSALTYSQVYNGRYTATMAMHELGHSFGDLCDEYTYTDEGFSYSDCVNCRASCSDWSDISSGCHLSCDARSDYYRPENSIMLSLSIPNFNQPSIHNSLAPRLDYFISKDSDMDGICETNDNCPAVANGNQSDIDGDGVGDVCDDDIDGDTFLNAEDNCPYDANDQTDTDGDLIGDVCDGDDDGDGVADSGDLCFPTPLGDVVNADGCSVSELCPCENSWKNHGAYVRCVAHTSEDFLAAELLTETEKDSIVSEAGSSDCGAKK